MRLSDPVGLTVAIRAMGAPTPATRGGLVATESSCLRHPAHAESGRQQHNPVDANLGPAQSIIYAHIQGHWSRQERGTSLKVRLVTLRSIESVWVKTCCLTAATF